MLSVFNERLAEEARREIYAGLWEFARKQGMTETEALVYAAQWDGVVVVLGKTHKNGSI